MQSPHYTIALTTSGVLGLLESYSLTVNNHYKYDFIFLIAGLWILYALRQQLHLHPFHYGLFAIFLLAHNLGVFGAYDRHFFTTEYDSLIHTYFGFVAALILYRFHRARGQTQLAYLLIPATVLILSAGHEVFEMISGWVLGNGEGVLFRGAGDIGQYDTIDDIRNNLLGALLGVALYNLYAPVGTEQKEARIQEKHPSPS